MLYDLKVTKHVVVNEDSYSTTCLDLIDGEDDIGVEDRLDALNNTIVNRMLIK